MIWSRLRDSGVGNRMLFMLICMLIVLLARVERRTCSGQSQFCLLRSALDRSPRQGRIRPLTGPVAPSRGRPSSRDSSHGRGESSPRGHHASDEDLDQGGQGRVQAAWRHQGVNSHRGREGPRAQVLGVAPGQVGHKAGGRPEEAIYLDRLLPRLQAGHLRRQGRPPTSSRPSSSTGAPPPGAYTFSSEWQREQQRQWDGAHAARAARNRPKPSTSDSRSNFQRASDGGAYRVHRSRAGGLEPVPEAPTPAKGVPPLQPMQPVSLQGRGAEGLV